MCFGWNDFRFDCFSVEILATGVECACFDGVTNVCVLSGVMIEVSSLLDRLVGLLTIGFPIGLK